MIRQGGVADIGLTLNSRRNDSAANQHQLWEGDVSLRAPSVFHEQPLQIKTRFIAPGQCRIALYANGEHVARQPLSILRAKL